MLSEILTFIAGIGVFLFSIKLLSKSIEDLCGNKIRRGFNKLSNNRFKSFGLGMGITLLLQSSTASIMMTSGFVSAGLISLAQAFGIVIGSNLASGITPYLLTFSNFKITGFFCALAGVGAFLLILSKKPLVKKIANAIVAFSLVFVGLQLISSATEIFKQNPTFLNFFTSTTHPLLLLLIGFVFTLLIQSSLGTLAVIITLVPSIIPLQSAIFIVYGANLGSALTTSLFAYISSNKDGKKMAIFHTLINVVGTIVFSVISLFDWVSILSWIEVPVLILTTVNLLFNLFDAALFLALIKPSMWLVNKIVGKRKHRAKNKYEIEYKDDEPSAVTVAKVAEKCVLCFESLKTLTNKTIDFVQSKEGDIKTPTRKIDYLIDNSKNLQMFTLKIPNTEGNTEQNEYVEKLFIILKMVERNSINCKKIIETLIDEDDKKIVFSNKILKYVQKLIEKINELFTFVKVFIEHPDCDFDLESHPDFNRIIEINTEISQIKLSAKTYIMKNGFNSQLSIVKNTRYLSLLNYITIIANNVIDMAFAFETDWQEKHKSQDYEQIDIASLLQKIDSEAV